MILNLSITEAEKEITKEIIVGDNKITRSISTKLFGMETDDQQNWKEQFNGLTNSLNKRMFAISRISNKIPQKEVLKVTRSVWISKLCYGLQLCNQVRTNIGCEHDLHPYLIASSV